LIAYVVPASEVSHASLDAQVLRAFVAERLPQCMVPAPLHVVAGLPLTAHGKIDHAALAAIDEHRRVVTTTYAPPRTPVEVALVEIWTETLAVRAM
jgi:acyl-coenzyme A synthetase/AMP-(fatty) acid ligase